MLVNNLNDPMSLFENRTAGTHRVLVELRGVTSNRFGIGARITIRSGEVEQTRLVMGTRGYMSAGEAVEHFGLGAATKIDVLEVRWPSGNVQVLPGSRRGSATRHRGARGWRAGVEPAAG